MIQATRRWFQRNRTNIAIGGAVLGAGYLAGQYVVAKIQEARQSSNEDRIAKEKYAPSPTVTSSGALQLTGHMAVSDDDSSRTKKIAHTLS